MNQINKKLEVNYRSVVILRSMLSLIFIVASLSHLLKTEKTISRLEQAHFGYIGSFFGPPQILVILSGIVMLVAGLFLLFGYKTSWAAVVLIAVLIPITLTVQVGQMATIGPLFKNVAILGGLLFFSLNPNLKFKK